MSGRAIIIIVVGIIVVSGIILYNIEAASVSITQNVNRFYSGREAQNIAQSGVNMALGQLSNDATWRTGFPSVNMLGGKASVSVYDSTWNGRQVIKILSVGIMNIGTASQEKDTSIAYLPKGFYPPGIKGLVTAQTDVGTLGSFVIDARNYTMSGTLVPGTGTVAISTTKAFDQDGSSLIGGTNLLGTDFAPSASPDTSILYQGVSPTNFPGTPDSVMGGADNGYPEGTLKALAKSGAGGGQYSANGSGITIPLRGVTYIESSYGGGMDGTGILVIHNSGKNAVYSTTSGTFKGILIVDDLVRVHSNVYGAIVILTKNPSSGNCLGNGSGGAYYSREAIYQSTGSLTLLGHRSSGAVLAWWE
ncbi:MAG TPA: hypothetical protein VES59_03875 [Bacteroidota bacterium]|nr:hypothetical protein [Bacteroidota bacterium]